MDLPHPAGIGRNLGLNDKQLNTILDKFARAQPAALKLIDISFLSEDRKVHYRDLLRARIKRIQS